MVGYMNTFVMGIVVGFVLFGVIAIVSIFNRMQLEIGRLSREVENTNKALQMLVLKVSKIEKITVETLGAAETFVDGLRASAEQSQMMPPRRGSRGNSESFDDLRQSFEDGIKDMEHGMDNSDDEDSDGPPEPWK
jgi:hypothetical protein